MRQRVLNVLIALDQLAYVLITLGWGYPDETLSSAAFRAERDGKRWGRIARPVFDFLLSPFEREHCYQAYLAEKQRLQQPQELRNS